MANIVGPNIFVKGFTTDGEGRLLAVQLYDNEGVEFEFGPKALKAYKHSSDLLFVKSVDEDPTTAYSSLTSTVTVTYDAENDTVSYNSDTYERSADDDIDII